MKLLSCLSFLLGTSYCASGFKSGYCPHSAGSLTSTVKSMDNDKLQSLLGTWMSAFDQKELNKNVNCPGIKYHSNEDGVVKVFYSYRLNDDFKKKLIEEKNEGLSAEEAEEEYQIGYAGQLYFKSKIHPSIAKV